jgi:DNA-binding winged helix-turn-helix (wHTH) protein
MTEDKTGPGAGQRYRFGIFEVDAATGELRRQGLRVKLNTQPFQVLLMLLDRPGELVTREEISRALWPDGTFVDYEHGVNSAVNRIREALGDSAANPRFLETLARRGYRFIAPVERVGSGNGASADGGGAAGDGSPAAASESGADTAEEEVRGAAIGERKSRIRILATAEELPRTSYAVVQTIFILFQLMYLGFYVGALANLAEIAGLFSPLPNAESIYRVLIVTAAILIPVRAFVLCAALFHAPDFRGKFSKMWPFLIVFDVLWSLAPFLLLHHINFGLALASTTLLVYSPFAQRSLVLMGAGGTKRESTTVV